jgi:diadenosine tetraphosphate (Ap4A) HIT family hydrolase
MAGAGDCIFCNAEDRILVANHLAFATRDAMPVSPGHTLIVPRRHCEDPFALTRDEVMACLALLEPVRADLMREPNPPDGFNIGINVGAAGGQGVAHVHCHVIPRWHGDVPDPRGGIRNILPFEHRRHRR